MSSEPVLRTTARVIPVNKQGQVLLLFGQDPARPDEPYWFSIGGAAEAEESLEQAAVRELFEETGIAIDINQLTAPFPRNSHSFTFDHVNYLSDSTFFAARLDDITVTFAGLGDGEVGNIFHADWWAPEDLTDAVPLSNPQLPEIARMAVEATTGTRP